MTDMKERAIDALDEATTSLKAADDDSLSAQLREEQRIIDTLSDELAECYLEGLNMAEGRFAQAISETSRLTKTEAKKEITRKIREAETEEESPVNVWVSENLAQVRVIRTTDHISDTRYVWVFDDGTTVETGSNHRTHFMWPEFRDEIYDAAGPYLTKPEDGYVQGEDWREFIVHQIQEHKIEKESIGPRTRAIEYLKKRIRNADGFGDLQDAADYQGVYIDLEPPDDDPDPEDEEDPLNRVESLMFQNSWVKDAAEEHEVTTRAIQNELDARGFTVDGRRVSETKYVGGRYQTFWKLNGSFASPASYEPDSDGDSDDEAKTESDSDTSAASSEDSDSDTDTGEDGDRDHAANDDDDDEAESDSDTSAASSEDSDSDIDEQKDEDEDDPDHTAGNNDSGDDSGFGFVGGES